MNTPADCAGLKIRVINSQVYIQTFRALGATAVAMDPSELYLALQQGVVDGFEYPLPDLISYKFYEVSKYLSLDGHTTDFFLVSINKALWEGIAEEEQGMMSQAMQHGDGLAVAASSRERSTSRLVKLKTLMQVNELSRADKAAVRRCDAACLSRSSSRRSARTSSTSRASSLAQSERVHPPRISAKAAPAQSSRRSAFG